MLIENNATVLFQGDSITDWGRNRDQYDDLGHGYTMMAASWFLATHPELQVKFLNRGIGGDRVQDLKRRWKEDCLDLKPTLVSLMIGINDCWRNFDSSDPMPVEQFEADYRYLLEQIKENLGAKILLIEPFVLPFPEDRKKWRADLDPKIHVVRALAREFGTLLIPMDGIFNAVSTFKGPEFWANDGVHPTQAGHALMAKEWLKAVKAL